MQAFRLEDDVDDYVKKELTKLGLMKNKDFNVKSQMSPSLKNALLNASKTKDKTSYGEPDFSLEKYTHPKNKESVIPIIIENKLHAKNLKKLKNDALQNDDHSISKFAVNGALHYAQNILRDKEKYKECIAIGIAGDDEENLLIEVYYVFASGINSHKLTNAKNLHFLESQESFNAFYKECTLTEEEKHFILIKTKADLNETAKKLNRLMHNHNITAPQRVLYVSGMLLSMQEIKGKKEGLKPSDLKGELTDTSRDGVLVFNQISEFLKTKNLSEEKRDLMLASFKEISKDPQRDKETSLDKAISMLLKKDSSITKQIFTFLYEFVHKPINESDNTGHLDIMGELYSEFLKYALGDGKELGIVLTPPYVTKMMSELLGVNANSFVMDLATGSGQALKSNVEILKKHSLLASIKMPTDLFMPQAGVQTSVYIFKAHEPHDYEKPVKFIDFRNDGFKRTKRGLNETSNPTKRYEEIIKIYKAGLNAKVSKELWGDLKTIYIEDFIAKPHKNKHAKDFNFEAHQKNETKPELENFKRTIADYLSYEVGLILKNQTPPK
ncbi:hypothetical protein BTM392_05380 [Helicobacter pylori]